MTEDVFWDKFILSGSVEDYLQYCRNSVKKEQDGIEVYNRRTDNKRE